MKIFVLSLLLALLLLLVPDVAAGGLRRKRRHPVLEIGYDAMRAIIPGLGFDMDIIRGKNNGLEEEIDYEDKDKVSWSV